jgi:hypothetical protein
VKEHYLLHLCRKTLANAKQWIFHFLRKVVSPVRTIWDGGSFARSHMKVFSPVLKDQKECRLDPELAGLAA